MAQGWALPLRSRYVIIMDFCFSMNSETKHIIFLLVFEIEKISFYSVSPCRFTKNKFMKSLLALAFCIVSFATISCSQKINEKDLPALVKTAFSNKYPS